MVKLSYIIQYGIAKIITRMFTIRYTEKDSMLASNPTLSLVNDFVRIPLEVKNIGVIIANTAAIQTGDSSLMLVASVALAFSGGFTTPDRLMTIVHATMLNIPKK